MNRPVEAVGQTDADLLADLHDILILLALGSGVIASPNMPPLLAQVIAVMMQNTALAWADLLATTEDLSVAKGGQS